jgi:5'-nucleotidase
VEIAVSPCYDKGMKNILLTNDDGYNCVGFYPLLKELEKHHNITAVAPKEQKSWVGKSISAHSDVNVEKIQYEDHEIYTVTGTPADCVQIGLYDILPSRPDFVVSGINVGENVGHGRILSSGTIGAAMEGAIDGVVSVAASLCDTRDRGLDYFDRSNYKYFENAAVIVTRVLELLETIKLPSGIDVISINVPFDAPADADIEITVPYIEPYGKLFTQNESVFNHVGAPVKYENLQDGTDLKAVYEGKVAITPIDLRLATKEAVTFLQENLQPLWNK